jgi:hypothetical protein
MRFENLSRHAVHLHRRGYSAGMGYAVILITLFEKEIKIFGALAKLKS